MFIFCFLIIVSSCLASPMPNIGPQSYIKDILSKTDDSVKPCDNFGKYVCGKIPNGDKSVQFEFDMQNLMEKDFENNANPKTEDEKLIRKFYKSCKLNDITTIFDEIDILKSAGKWPVNKDFTDQEFAKFFGFLASAFPTAFVNINYVKLRENRILEVQRVVNFNFKDELLANTLKKFKVTSEESSKIVKDFKSLVEKYKEIEYSEFKVDKFNNVAELKEKSPNFDWETFFITLAKELDLDEQFFFSIPIEVQMLEKLNKIFSIIKTTDSKTVMNYIIWRYLLVIPEFECSKYIAYFYTPIAINNIKEEHKNSVLKELDVFKRFEKSFNKIKSQLDNPESEDIVNSMKLKKYIYENFENFLSGHFFADLIAGCEFNENTHYKNIINALHVLLKNFISPDKFNAIVFVEFLQSPVTKHILNEKQDTSVLHSFVTFNTELWDDTFLDGKIFENRKINDNCFALENKTKNSRNMYYLTSHMSYDISLKDYLNYVNEHEEEFKKDTAILSELGLNHEKAFMLALTHEKCLKYETNDIDTTGEDALWFFKHSKTFSNTWGCKAGDNMYSVCDDSTFTLNFHNNV